MKYPTNDNPDFAVLPQSQRNRIHNLLPIVLECLHARSIRTIAYENSISELTLRRAVGRYKATFGDWRALIDTRSVRK